LNLAEKKHRMLKGEIEKKTKKEGHKKWLIVSNFSPIAFVPCLNLFLTNLNVFISFPEGDSLGPSVARVASFQFSTVFI
jgi:hypothetical protein